MWLICYSREERSPNQRNIEKWDEFSHLTKIQIKRWDGLSNHCQLQWDGFSNVGGFKKVGVQVGVGVQVALAIASSEY